MKIIKKTLLFLLLAFVALLIGFNLWGAATLGTITPAQTAERDMSANRVVMVMGATGRVGDGLLKAAMDAPEVEKVHVITRRSSPRIDAGVASGKLTMHLHEDFTDYSDLADVLGEVNTVLWALGTSSLQVDDATYTWIHVDFPLAFVKEWLGARTHGPMSFHNVTGMGTDPEGSQYWAREKGRAENTITSLGEGTGLRNFSYRSGWISPPEDTTNPVIEFFVALLTPGDLVIEGQDLGNSMLEISARTKELPNGTVLDNADSIAYAKAYQPGG